MSIDTKSASRNTDHKAVSAMGNTPIATLRVEGVALPVALLDVHLDNGAPRFTPSGQSSPVWTDGRLLASLLDADALAALCAGAGLRLWAGTERVLHLQPTRGPLEGGAPVDPMALSWVAHGEVLARFDRLTLAQAFDAAQKAWLRAPRPHR
jgi:hypothetical protein